MKISYQWLKNYIDPELNIDELKRVLIFSGIEAEGVEYLPALPPQIVSAKVLSAERIAGSDHLQVCLVDNGTEQLQIVCGAPNCRKGLTVALAGVGSVLGDITIKKAKLRGVESHGMLCSERELGLSDIHDGIIELDDNTPLGIELNSLLDLPDYVLELEITPNRSDLLGYLGIGRDLSASTGKEISEPFSEVCVSQNVAPGLRVEIIAKDLCPRYTGRVIKGVKIAPSPLWLRNFLIRNGLRPINNVVDITNFVMLECGHPLHAFDLNALQTDDKDALILVRNAQEGEIIAALDGKTYSLTTDDLVIADAVKPIALAGIIGGANSHITESTSDIVLEAAAFDARSVRRTSYRYKINTDSAYRFERHLSPETADMISDRATSLILQIAGGEVIGELVDQWLDPQSKVILGIRPARYESIIGYRLADDQIKQYLELLGLKFIQYGAWKAGKIANLSEIYCYHTEQIEAGITEFGSIDCVHSLYFEVPSYRVDLEREIDLIEELARLDGYDKAPRKTEISLIMDRHAHSVKRKLKDYLVSCGLYEAVNFSFDDPEHLSLIGYDPQQMDAKLLRLINPQSSNQSLMRISLLPQLLKTMRYNLDNAGKDIGIFELNKTYLRISQSEYQEPYQLCALMTGAREATHWQQKSPSWDYYAVKGMATGLLDELRIRYTEAEAAEQPYLIAISSRQLLVEGLPIISFGKIKPEIGAGFGIDVIDLKQDLWFIECHVENLIRVSRDRILTFVPLPKYPNMERDLSFLIDTSVSFYDLQSAIQNLDRDIISSVEVFDEYMGKQIPEGFRSLSLHIVFNDREKTLTIERIDALVESIIKMLQDQWQIKMR